MYDHIKHVDMLQEEHGSDAIASLIQTPHRLVLACTNQFRLRGYELRAHTKQLQYESIYRYTIVCCEFPISASF